MVSYDPSRHLKHFVLSNPSISGSGWTPSSATPNDAPPGAVLIVRKEPKSPACPPSPETAISAIG